MGQSTEELTSQIEGTRQRMASDLDTLQDRVSPSAIVDRRKQAVRSRFASARGRVMGTARAAGDSVTSVASGAPSPSGMASSMASSASDTAGDVARTAQERYEGAPLAAGLVAFGAGVVLASMVPATRAEAEAAHRVVETAREQGQPLVDQARSMGEQLAGQAMDNAAGAAREVRDSAQESVEKVKDEGSSAVGSVGDHASGGQGG
jgi:hypothetical protein